MAKTKCSICTVNDASRVGEHVWPRWFLKLMDSQGKPPTAWSKNGNPILNSRGTQIALPRRTRVFLPVCQACNGKLAQRFEDPAIDTVTQLSTNRWLGGHSAAEWQAVGMWWAKIGLMLGHADARYEHRKLNEEAIRFNSSPPEYKWMVDGTAVPVDLSVFVHHSSMDAGETEAILGVPEHIALSNGAFRVSHVFQIVTPNVAVAVVSHPGLTVVHPLVERGEAWELLRGSPSNGDLAALPLFGHRRVVFRQGLVAHEGFQIDSSETSRLMSLIAHEAEEVPEVYPRLTRSQARNGVRERLASGVRRVLGLCRRSEGPAHRHDRES
ncbi:hypothetical protein V6K52_09230 [Knoellia sp. S7-12]|uniref:hypothetical protein n=1 Tax=Knoellia sp. S7-12 TaxID=3126698 RepID=UPI0033689ED6